MKTMLIIFIGILPCILWAQQDEPNKIKMNIAIETYYLYDFNRPNSNELPAFLYSHPRHNQIGINSALIGLHYSDSTIHANFGLISGDYEQRSYAAEPEAFRHLYEANIGFNITGNLWLDVGVMPSHIGLESALTMDNWTLTHSILAHNSPFYETGVKVSYILNKWTFAFLVLNGWQNIKDNNSNKAVGTQIQWKPSEKVLINSSSFVGEGNNLSDSLELIRYFHDLYLTCSLTNELSLSASYDTGIQETAPGSNDFNTWWGTAFTAKYKITPILSVSARGEYYNDKDQVIVKTNTPDGFQINGFSVNMDYLLKDKVLLRLEGKILSSKDDLFEKGMGFSDSAFFIISSASFRL